MGTKNQRNILLVIILLLGVGLFAMYDRTRKLNTKLDISEQNTKALSDSVRTVKTKYGAIEASKQVLVTKGKKLDDLNSQLGNELKRTKGKVRQLNVLVAKLNALGHDTIHDTLEVTNTLIKRANGTFGLEWAFDTTFTDSNARHIAGISEFRLDTNFKVTPLTTKLLKDEMQIKITTGLREKDGKVEIFASSKYPGFEAIGLDGAIIDPKKHPVLKKFTKKKKWGVGPYVGIGFDGNLNSSMQVGIGLNYSLFRF